MLDTVLHGDQTTWHKTIRVPSNCTAAARPPSLAAEADLPLGPMQPAFSTQGSQSSTRHIYSECASAWMGAFRRHAFISQMTHMTAGRKGAPL